ncbi:hypothetical protein BJ944DRAFT_273595 [Cunninghamella echinulata]|nr:hypothetical protein BJ944DRAFT_273595 [Cunninghamella echinulata]
MFFILGNQVHNLLHPIIYQVTVIIIQSLQIVTLTIIIGNWLSVFFNLTIIIIIIIIILLLITRIIIFPQ